MKYKLTENTKTLENGTILYQIQALKDFDNIEAGDLGGWIEKESNLSQWGNCWVYGNARVFGDAWVYGDAQVFGDATVYGDAQVSGDAQVYGNAWVSGYARVSGDAYILTGGFNKDLKISKTPLSLVGLLWTVSITETHIIIGCESHLKEEWKNFTDEEISKMDQEALKFWTEFKYTILILAN
jgi:YdcK Beta solenoid repeat